MLNADNELLVSPASYWEIAIKISLGKYTLDDDFEAFIERQTVYSEFTPLPSTRSNTPRSWPRCRSTIATLRPDAGRTGDC